MDYQPSKVVSLKGHPLYTERWLQAKIVEDPTVLGLGELRVKDAERRQPRAGRLDLLLEASDLMTRYEVEIQLGATDESHIIRTIEYWDIERRRYPQYEHVAVIVAEDVTSRFLNVISLFNGFIPLVAIQLRALQVGDALTLSATTVLDQMTLGLDEDAETPSDAADRGYWERRSSPDTVAVVDRLLAVIREVTGEQRLDLKFNKNYIGLARDGIPDNFVLFVPRQHAVNARFKIPRSEELTTRIEDAGLDATEYDARRGRYRVRLGSEDIARHGELLREMIRRSSRTNQPESE